jgi:hypothetical protein
MPVPAVASAEQMPRRSRYLIPMDFPYRGEVIASLAVVGLFAHLVLAQLTLLLAVAFHVIGRVSRWRPQWLAVPAGAGLIWTLAIGPARAIAGFAAGPRQVLGYIGGVGSHPGHLVHPLGAYAGLAHWLPRQLPLALVLAAAEAAVAWWLHRLHAGDGFPAPRPGLVIAARRRFTAADIRSGGIVTSDGGCLGLDAATGRRAAVTWREAEGGVLCTGQTGPALTETGFLLAQAAIRRRKPVIVIDLTGSAWLADALAAGCVAAGAPLWRFGEPGTGYYEPLRGGDPARAAALVMGMIDWTAVSEQQRQACGAYLADAMAVLAAAPGDPRVPVLDELTALLVPDALAERLRRVPAYHPQRAALAERVGVSAGPLRADPAAVSAVATQIPLLRGSALGRWLGPPPLGAATQGATPQDRAPLGAAPQGPAAQGPAGQRPAADGPAGNGRAPQAEGVRISLGRTVRDRAVTLFSLDRDVHGRYATMIASLAALDLMTVCAELRGMSVPGDTLAWLSGCELLDSRVSAELIAGGPDSGTAVLLTTASAAAAERLAAEANVVLVRGPVDEAVAGRVAGLAGPAALTRSAAPGSAAVAGAAAVSGPAVPSGAASGTAPGQISVPAADLQAQAANAFALLVRGPQRRALPKCLHVPVMSARVLGDRR